MSSHSEIKFFFQTIRIFVATRGCTFTRNLACGMIMISENVTPITME